MLEEEEMIGLRRDNKIKNNIFFNYFFFPIKDKILIRDNILPSLYAGWNLKLFWTSELTVESFDCFFKFEEYKIDIGPVLGTIKIRFKSKSMVPTCDNFSETAPSIPI